MRFLTTLIRNLFHRARVERDLDEEMRTSLELLAEWKRAQGLDDAEARRQAGIELGGAEQVKEAVRDVRRGALLDQLGQNLRYTARTLLRSPGFAAIAILTLGLGIGAATTMFSVVEAVLLRPLPYSDPARLVQIRETNPLKHWTGVPAAPANYADWRSMNHVFTDMGGYASTDVFLTGQGEPQRLKAVAVTGNFFSVLGVSPQLGRGFVGEETYEGKDRVAILSYGLWQAGFGGDTHIAGRTVSLTGKTYTVIGVMPAEFFFPTREAQLWIPLGFTPKQFIEHRRPHYLDVIARLRPGVSLPQAEAEMHAIAHRLERTYPGTNTKMDVRLDEFHAALSQEKRPALLMLLAAVGVLFLVVCSNVANLQLGRAAARAREFGIRQALGAGRRRLVTQILTESLVLSTLGGVLGLLLAGAAQSALIRLAPTAIPRFAELQLNPWLLCFALAITFGAPLLFGIAPALASGRAELLRDRSETVSRGSRSLRDALVACQVALSVVLVAGAMLLVRSLINLEAVDPGFTPARAISFQVVLPRVRYQKDDQVVHAVESIERRLRMRPQVRAAGASCVRPLGGYAYTTDATVEGRGAADYERELRVNSVTPDYFRAIGTTLLRGRFFDERDTSTSTMVAIVNQTLEKAYFRGESAIGKRLRFGRPTDRDPWITVVGVAADQLQDGLNTRTQPEAYAAFAQQPSNAMVFVVRGTGDPDSLMKVAREDVRAIDAELALNDLAPIADVVRASAGDQRFRAVLLASFAALALFLAALGVYGVLAYSVTQRRRELGVRLALGAPPGRLFGMVLGDGLRPVIAGSLMGLLAAYGAARLIRSMLFEVQPADPATYGATVAVLAIVALCACAIPAARALRVDPLICLREQ